MESKAERTKKFIIEKAAPIFNTQGYAGTSISDITHATNLTKGSIYGNFRDKNEIAIHAFKFNLNVITTAFSEAIQNEETYINKLLAYPRVYRRIYKTVIQNGGCPLLNTLVDADDTHPELKKKAVNAIKDWKKNIIQLVNDGKKNDEISESIDSSFIAESMISLFEGGGILAKTTEEDSFIYNALKQIEEMIKNLKK